jgi:hypothetical protein
MKYVKFDITRELEKAEKGRKTQVNLVSVLIAAQDAYPERVARLQEASRMELEFKCCDVTVREHKAVAKK